MKFIIQTPQDFDSEEFESIKLRTEQDELIVDSPGYTLVPRLFHNAELRDMSSNKRVEVEKCYILAKVYCPPAPDLENAIPNLAGTQWTENIK